MAKKKVIIDLSLEGNKSIDKSLKVINKGLGKIGKVGTKSFNLMGKAGKKAFGLIGKAFKGMGIGILLGLLSSLWEAMKKNQKIMDAFEKITTAVGVVMKPLVDAVGDLISGLIDGSDKFDALGKVMKGLITLVLTPMKLAFYNIKLGIEKVMLGWYQMKTLFGNKEAIKEVVKLNKSIQETEKQLTSVVVNGKDAAKSIISNVGEAVGEVGSLVKKTTENLSKISIKGLKNQSDIMNKAKKDLETLDAKQEEIMLKAQTEEERQRQIRDDVSKSMAERIAANNKLGELLIQQGKDEQDIVDRKIKAQKIILSQDKNNIENQNKLKELENQKLEITERLTGQSSEQQTNTNSLLQEERDNLKAIKDLKDKIYEKDGTELEKNIAARELEAENLLIELEQSKLSEQEKADAILAINNKLAIDLQAIKDKDKADKKEANDKEVKDAKFKANVEKKLKEDTLKSNLNATSSALGQASDMLGQETEAGKAAAIAKTTIDTYTGATAAYASLAGIPIIGPALGIAAAGLAITGGLKNVQKITSTKTEVPKINTNVAKFANGGVVQGSTSGDRVPIMANGGELMSNQRQKDNILMAVQNGQIGNQGFDYERLASLINDKRVYVLEQDITGTQVEVREREKEFSN